MIQLINDESITNEVNIGTQKWKVTNKRLLFSNQGKEAYTSIKDLKTVDSKEVNLTQYKWNIPAKSVLFKPVAIIILVLTLLAELTFGAPINVAAIGAVIFCIPSAFLVIWILSLIKKSTAYTKKMVLFTIRQKDNKLFINSYFDQKYEPELKQLEQTLNCLIYA